MLNIYRSIVVLVLCCNSLSASAESITIAVASNFMAVMDEVVGVFEAQTGHEVQVAYGSSGRIYAQIKNGAPFDVFFSADQEKAAALEAEGQALWFFGLNKAVCSWSRARFCSRETIINWLWLIPGSPLMVLLQWRCSKVWVCRKVHDKTGCWVKISTRPISLSKRETLIWDLWPYRN